MTTTITLPEYRRTSGQSSSILSSHLVDQVAATLRDDECFIESIRNQVWTSKIQEFSNHDNYRINSFDSVYISDLTPDFISNEMISSLTVLNGIRDDSPAIIFQDE